MAKPKIEFRDKEVLLLLEDKLKLVAFKTAEKESARLKAAAPVYEGPYVRGGRVPGTMKRGIKATKLRKWARVYIPFPSMFVEYGGTVKRTINGKKKFLGRRKPHPFIRPTFDAMIADYVRYSEHLI